MPSRRRRAGDAGNGRAPAGRNEQLARIAARYDLTPMQALIAGRLLHGQSLKAIAHDLRRHRRTIADLVCRLKRKTGTRTLAQLVARLGAAAGHGERSLDVPLLEFAARHGFTVRQVAVLRLVVGGKTIPAAALNLRCHLSTVKVHLDAVRKKAGARTCAEIAAAIACQNGTAR